MRVATEGMKYELVPVPLRCLIKHQ